MSVSMNIGEMVAHNTQLQRQLNTKNKKYYGDMIVYIRSSGIDDGRGEELLLELLLHLIQAQKEGRSAQDVFGSDPSGYCRELVSQLPRPKMASRLSMLVMIPWIAVTWLFLAEGLMGLLLLITGTPDGYSNQMSLTILLAVAVTSLLLVKLVMLLMNKTAFTEHNRKFYVLFLLIYIVSIAAVVAAGFFLKSYLPVFSVSPWAAIAIFAVGYAGQKFWLRSGAK
ncbi:DUF1129 family protein [Paenibacillus sp. FJAT-26967]|uniref:DUF1129 family protein n=1 Tax=Paenibacillus sp. FJAT-26967 TaxID=1729690 RepID=UPI000AB90A46|nr:DUF1129 family protein [Paenibacillus sp. FJAT-26967]